MASTQTPPYDQEETPYSTPTFRPPSARRNPSLSPSSSPSHSWTSSFESLSFSFNDEETPPYSPISNSLKFKGIPFSWEQIPGIPKHQDSKKMEYSGDLLLPPPPPAAGSSISPKKHHRFKRDPFFAALVECSKDDHHDLDHGTNFGNISKITRSFSNRLGFINMYMTSCKRTCGVSQSIVCLPRASPHYLLYRNSS